MSTLKFQDPPVSKNGRPLGLSSGRLAIANELKANPGRWALVKEDTYPSITGTWKKLGFETRSSSVGKTNGRCDVYARWVGAES